MKVTGEFTYTSIGARHVTIPLAGRGHCEIDSAGLTASGYQPTGAALPVLGGISGGALVAAVSYLLFPTADPTSFVVPIVGAGVTLGCAARQPNRKKPTKLRFPWASIRKVTTNGKRISVLIKGHKPAGQLLFCPETQHKELADALRGRAGAA